MNLKIFANPLRETTTLSKIDIQKFFVSKPNSKLYFCGKQSILWNF